LAPDFSSVPWARGLAEGSAGILVGGLFGVVTLAASAVVFQSRTALPGRQSIDGPEGPSYGAQGAEKIIPLALCGLFLGWQAAAGIASMAALLWTATSAAASFAAPLRRWRLPL